MVKILEQALAEVATLPDAAQEEVGRQILAHVEKLRRLRADIEDGICSLDAGEGRSIDMAEFTARMKKKYASKRP